MPAEIDSMMFVNEIPWHRLGKRLENPANAAVAIEAAGLSWDVQLQPIYTGVERTIKVKDRFAVCRNDRLDHPDGGQLGVVGRDYTPLQNREAFAFLDPLVGENSAIYHTAGALRGGRRVWMLAKLPGEIRVIGDDIAQKFLLLSNSHDGGSAVRIGLTPIRVVCQNTLNLALRGMAGMAIRHESNVAQRVKQAHELLGLVNDSFNQAGQMMQRMARTTVTAKRLGEYFESVLPTPTHYGPERQKVLARHNRLTDLFETGIGQDIPGVKGSLWAGYNAVTQFVDRELWTKRNKEPLNSIWFGEGERIKKLAFNKAAEFMDASQN
jgi:phage/plasmid-like protein (TIGR03299 family)